MDGNVMRTALANFARRAARWLDTKSKAPVTSQSQEPGSTIDAYKRHRAPTQLELLNELKNTAYACATMNAAVCGSFAPKLYVATNTGQASPKCPTKKVDRNTETRVRAFSRRA